MPSTDKSATAPTVRVFWTDPEKVLPFSPRHVATELERALGDMGIRLSWSTVTPATVSGPSDFRVVLLSTDRRQEGRPLLGVTRPGPPPISWLFLGSVRSALGLDPAAARTAAEVGLLSRALSRVIVHELVHSAAPEHPHSDEGLMSRCVDRGILLGRGVHLDAPTREALLSGLAWPPRSVSAPSTTATFLVTQ